VTRSVCSLVVADLLGTAAAAAAVFAGTNVDDLIVLTVLFLSARAAKRPRAWQIWVGQYAGMGVLVAASALAALGFTLVPDRWIGLLGVVPFTLGVRGLVTAFRAHNNPNVASPVVATGLVSIAGLTIANGADNIAVYTPMLRTIGIADSVVTVTVFALLVAVWCTAGSWLGSHKSVIKSVRRVGHWAVPAVFMLIGAVIFAESGIIGELQKLR
jgi:cadmium resistance protein CadD (predicted permease)